MIGRKKKTVFAYIKDRIWKRINSWRGRSLLRAGKEVMIKSVLQVIPSYIMSIYLLPDSTIKDIERMMNSFWWGGGVNNKGIRWLAWDRMTYPKEQGGMGFRDLHSFNLAMIAKQGWNIMKNSHTLVARLYKARYFPNSSLFDSKIGHNPSYAWRGIWKARHILTNGCRWRIGNGASIKVMSEPWLRDVDGAWIPSPQNLGVHNLHVNDLMLPNVKVWDKRKVETLFSIDIANHILNIPLFDTFDEDKLVWKDSPYSEYSVKSGYKLMVNDMGKVLNASQPEDWKSLWTILAPPKTKHLLWRIAKGCLPTRLRLQEKHVLCSLLCSLCNRGEEDEWHAIFSCNHIMQTWHSAGLEEVLAARLPQVNDVRDLILAVCSCEDKKLAGLFATVIWVLWNNRNNKVWNDVAEIGRNLGFKAKQIWEEWFMVQSMQHTRLYTTQQHQLNTWQQPPHGWYKCNVDAGFHKELNKTSSGWCLRDHLDRFIRAETNWIEGNCSIIEGESIALIEALRAMEQRGITHVVFETDSKSIVDTICHFRGGRSEFSFLISQIKNIMLCNPNFEVKFIKRQANMVAHTLARTAIS